MIRIKVSSHIFWVGYKRYYSKSARVLKDEDKIRVASNEVESTFNPSNAAGNIRSKNLKLVTHDLFKKSKTQTKFKKIGLSEAIQKIVKSVVKKDIIENDESPKVLPFTASFNILNLNVIVSQKEKEKMTIIEKKIQSKWNNKNKRFINIHEIIFDPYTLNYAYGKLLKLKSANTKKDNGINLDWINYQKIIELSNDLLKGSWKTNVSRHISIYKKKKPKHDH